MAFSTKGDGAADSPLGPSTEEGPFGLLNAVLDELLAVGYLAPEHRPDSDVACWAAVHGFAELCLDGPLRLLPSEMRDAAESQLLDTIERGLGAG